MRPRLLALLLAAACSLAVAQYPVSPKDRAIFNQAFDNVKGDALHCYVRSFPPFVDFAFRFDLGYEVSCEMRQFEGLPGELRTYLRVRPENGEELFLADAFTLPGIPKDRPVDPSHLRTELQFTGVLASGAGLYHMELLVFDNRGRIFRHNWKVKAFPHGSEAKIAFRMQPGSLVPLRAANLPLAPNNRGDAHVTVLLNAAPLNPRSTKLRAWDRAFLLEALASLLRELPYSSVRVVAFNLAQQREVFRQDDFSQTSMAKLNTALRNLELGTITYHALEQRQGWADLLLTLLKSETATKPSSDAVIFLGPTAEFYDKVPRELLASYAEALPHLFCLSYYPRYGSEFPDAIQYLTSSLKGRVFRIHTPNDLAQNLDKLKQEMTAGQTSRH